MRISDGGADSVISEDFVAKSVSASRGEALQAGMPAFPSAVAESTSSIPTYGRPTLISTTSASSSNWLRT